MRFHSSYHKAEVILAILAKPRKGKISGQKEWVILKESKISIFIHTYVPCPEHRGCKTAASEATSFVAITDTLC